MTDQDLKNNSIVEGLVSKYFSLQTSSLERFKENLKSPKMIEPIQEMFKDSEDLRLRFNISENSMGYMDTGWAAFKETFICFRQKYDEMSYSDFRENKITVNKNQIKLKKALVKFYQTNTELARTDLQHKSHIGRYEWSRAFNGYISESWNWDINYAIQKDNTVRFISKEEAENFINPLIEKTIMGCLEHIGTLKMPIKNDLQVVVSRNFADWIMCSTSESWTSCLNLQSNYESAFWSGLPGTIVDPNRLLIYVTDGSKKSYRGITVDKFLQRTWAIYSINGEVHPLRWYDSKKIENKTIKEVTGLNLRLNSGKEFKSFTNFKPLFHTNGKSSFIYHDNSRFDDLKNGKVYIYGVDDSDCWLIDTDGELVSESAFYFEDGLERGLEDIIQNDSTVSDFSGCDHEDSCSCRECGERVRYDDDYYFDGTYYCESCFSDLFFYCDSCNETHSRDEYHTTGYESFCNNCSGDYREINGNWYSVDDCIMVHDELGKDSFGPISYIDMLEKDLDKEIFVRLDNGIWYEKDECEYISSENKWYTKSYIKEFNDLNQMKLDFTDYEKIERERNIMGDIVSAFSDPDAPDVIQSYANIFRQFGGVNILRSMDWLINTDANA